MACRGRASSARSCTAGRHLIGVVVVDSVQPGGECLGSRDAQRVARDVESDEPRELKEALRDGAGELVVGKRKLREVGEVAEFGRN